MSMTEGCIMVKAETVKSLEHRLRKLEEINENFLTFFPSALNYGHKQMLKYASKIGANVIAITEEDLLADLREYKVNATFYRLNE
jgi:hypothetical protein